MLHQDDVGPIGRAPAAQLQGCDLALHYQHRAGAWTEHCTQGDLLQAI